MIEYINIYLNFIITIPFAILVGSILYKFYNIPVTKRSILSYCVIYVELYLFILGFLTFFKSLSPIYIEDLSKNSLFRYPIFLLILIIIGTFYYIFKFKNSSEIEEIFKYISYPYVKEEITHMLNNIYGNKLYNIANIIIYNVRENFVWKFTFLGVIFFTYHGI